MSRAWTESGTGPRALLLGPRRMTIAWYVVTFVLGGISQGCHEQGGISGQVCHPSPSRLW